MANTKLTPIQAARKVRKALGEYQTIRHDTLLDAGLEQYEENLMELVELGEYRDCIALRDNSETIVKARLNGTLSDLEDGENYKLTDAQMSDLLLSFNGNKQSVWLAEFIEAQREARDGNDNASD